MTSQTVLTKILAIVSQIVLAWRLDQKDFALVALALAVAAFASLFQQIGVREVLIQRHLDFPKLASAATWLTFLLGIHTGLATAVAGLVAARLYNEPALIGLI